MSRRTEATFAAATRRGDSGDRYKTAKLLTYLLFNSAADCAILLKYGIWVNDWQDGNSSSGNAPLIAAWSIILLQFSQQQLRISVRNFIQLFNHRMRTHHY